MKLIDDSDTAKELLSYLTLDLSSLERFCGHRVGSRLGFLDSEGWSSLYYSAEAY